MNELIDERPKTPLELLTESAIVYAECDPVDDVAFNRALDNLRQSANRYCKRSDEFVSRKDIEPLREQLKAALGRLGRPRKLPAEEIARIVERVGGQAKAARELGVSISTVERALRWMRSVSHTS